MIIKILDPADTRPEVLIAKINELTNTTNKLVDSIKKLAEAVKVIAETFEEMATYDEGTQP